MQGRIAAGISMLGAFARTDDGQDLLEYGMLAVLIAIFAIVAVTLVGNQVNTLLWEYIANNF